MKLVLALVLPAIRGAFFFVSEGEEKCFVEQIPPGLMVSAKYSCLDKLSGTCTIEFRRDSKLLFQQEVQKDTLSGTASYHSDAIGGELLVCVSCKQAKRAWFATHATRNRWQLQIERRAEADVFSHADAPAFFPIGPQTKVSQELSNMEKNIRELISTLDSMAAENEYEKTQEIDHRDVSETTNAASQWLSVLEISLMFAICIFQVWTLRDYFRAKHLI